MKTEPFNQGVITKLASQTGLTAPSSGVPQVVIGIDPGTTGAIAAIDVATGQAQDFDNLADTGRIGGKLWTIYLPGEIEEVTA